MEQDINKNIKILERMLKIEKECLHYDVSQDEIRAIEHLIKAYKELEEYYEEQNEVNAKFIPVSLVEETIEELNKQEKEELKGLKGQDRYFVKQMYQYKRSVLQELLEKRK